MREVGRRSIGTRIAALAVVTTSLLVPAGSAQAAAGTITPIVRGTAGSNGWYRSNVTVNWSFNPLPDSTSGCEARTITSDTRGTTLTCTATWGSSSSTDRETYRIDKTPPSVRAIPARGPDANGWYNHALPVSFSGSDAMSGMASCSSTRYAGPYNAHASVSGGCYDRAGNSAGTTYTFAYDSTPPTIKKLSLKHGKRTITLRWQLAGGAQREVVSRAPGKGHAAQSTIFQGKASLYRDKKLRIGHKYRYTVNVFDQAANKATRTITVVATGALTSPTPGAAVTRAPRLSWTGVKGASYYNVQLVRGGTIFSAWPSGTHLTLPRSWTYRGHHYRLHPGVYKWYVWPGYGVPSASHYGHVLGRSSFLYAR